ncbi:MAG: adenylate/guanylate cyclase domain-containing protein [Leptospiraceae bacterium]|nr:adenylate/guanylate cyclase domain-containing protein [Leptospiraceae bacterium]
MNLIDVSSILNDATLDQGIRNIISFESSRNEMYSRVDASLDSHIDTIEDTSSVESMMIDVVLKYSIRSSLEKIVPVRSETIFEITLLDYLLLTHTYYFDSNGSFINNPSLEKLDRYSEELTANSLNNIKIGTISIYGNAINEFDKGFLRSFGEKLNTAILSFNRRKYYREIELLTNNLNAIIGDDSTSITEKRTQIIKEVLFRIQAKEAHFIMIKDGSIPTIESVKMEDLEIAESIYADNGIRKEISAQKQDYMLKIALYAIKSTVTVDSFEDRKEDFGYAISTEIKVNKTKIGGAFVIFDNREFSSARQKIAMTTSLKVDDFIILNQDMQKEKETRERMEQVLIPMVGKEQANFLLEKKDFQKFSDPMARFIIVMLSDMKGSTIAADLLMIERKKYQKDDPYLLKKYNDYVQTINTYLGMVSEAVLTFEGVIDKYIGDAVMAEWGVPIEITNHKEVARKAILAAVFSNILTLEHNTEMQKNGADPMFILQQRFVLHCGEALAGVYGTSLRYNYTVMGATVNETARIESLPASEVGKVTISQEFYSLVEDIIEADCVGEFALKGKKEPVILYHFKSFKVNEFTSFAMQYVNKARESLFNENKVYNEFIQGKYNGIS